MNEEERNNNNQDSPEKKKLRVAFYIRVSKEDQVEKYGPDLQMNSLRALVESRQNDLEFAGEDYIYKDLGKSGSLKIQDRPGLKRLFKDLKYGKPFDVVAVYKIDRFARSLKVLLDVVDSLKVYDIDFISTLETIDTSSHFGKAMLGILGVFAELEKDMNQIKMDDGKKDSIVKGNKMRNVYGYTRYKEGNLNLYKIVESEAKVVKSIFDDFTSARMLGQVRDIGKRLEREKVYSPGAADDLKANRKIKGKYPFRWNNDALYTILSNEAYTGKYFYGKFRYPLDEEKGRRIKTPVPKEKWLQSKHDHPRIITDKVFNKAQELLKKVPSKSHQNAHTSEGNVYLLTGLLKCDSCKLERTDNMMYSWVGNSSHGLMQYKCKGSDSKIKKCKCIPIQAEDLDRIVLGEIKAIVKNPKAISQYVKNEELLDNDRIFYQEELLKNEKRLQELQIGKENIYKLYKMGRLTIGEYDIDLNDLEEQEAILLQEKHDIDSNLEGSIDSESYNKTFRVLSDILNLNIDEILEDKIKSQKLLGYIVEKVIIYSQENDGTYTISGKKREGQMIPFKIQIQFKLPQEFLDNYLVLNDIILDDEEDDSHDDTNGKGGGSGGGLGEKVVEKVNKEKEKLKNNLIRIKNGISPFTIRSIRLVEIALLTSLFHCI